jgi:hypothetical protein
VQHDAYKRHAAVPVGHAAAQVGLPTCSGLTATEWNNIVV